MEEREFGSSSNSLPSVPTDRFDTLAEDLAHQIFWIVINGLGVLIRVSENSSNVLRLRQDTLLGHQEIRAVPRLRLTFPVLY